MNYPEHTILLKDGSPCIIRPATGKDAEAMFHHFNLTHAQSDFLLSYPDENSFDIDQEKQYLQQKEASPDAVEFATFIEGHIVGSAGIEPIGKKDKVKHRAMLGISVEKNCWSKGIGSALMDACIDAAKLAGYAQLELEVVASNDSALKLYEKKGFTEFGRNPKGFRTREGVWQTLILMRLELPQTDHK